MYIFYVNEQRSLKRNYFFYSTVTVSNFDFKVGNKHATTVQES
jgi:hypothetical protein